MEYFHPVVSVEKANGIAQRSRVLALAAPGVIHISPPLMDVNLIFKVFAVTF